AWPVYSHLILILLMVVGACAGSTGGGIKVLRVKISLELIKIEIQKYMSPRKVFAIRINDDVIQENRVWLVLGMISSWFVLATFSVLILSLVHPDWTIETVVSVVFSSLGNTGPALGQYGPTQTWSGIGDFSMIWTMMLMWIGRLEILTVLVLIHPKTWIG
ncbi:MAG: TrkH family potassium uptake protein, partial [Euryarchaeota archaeon]|nr:TrkH family potassium uptake protein [Euryarchaeota archaeon]